MEARHDGPRAVTSLLAERSPGGHGAAAQGSRAGLVAPDDVPALVEEVEAAEVVGLDLETTGLDPRRHRIRLLSVATAHGAWVLDLFVTDPAPVLAALKQKTLVIHNAAFDLGFLHEFGYEHGGEIIDTMLLSQLLHAGAEVAPLSKGQTSHALDAVCQRELGVELDKTQQTAAWGGDLTPEMADYAARDAEVLIPLHQRLMEEIENANLYHVAEIERRALPAILWMTRAGVPFDEARWLELAEEAREEADQIGARLRDMIHPRPNGKDWNWNSASQVKEALAAFGIHPPDTRDETLAQYDHEFVGLLREYRKKSKLASSYGEKWLHNKDGSRRVVDDRIYPSWKQIGAATGRMACSDPNLQSIPMAPGTTRASEHRRAVPSSEPTSRNSNSG